MNFKKFILFFIVISSLQSCSIWKDDDLASMRIIDKDMKPSWMNGNNKNDGIFSIGISPKSESGFNFQVRESELSGRQNIIAKVKNALLFSLKERAFELGIGNPINFEKVVEDFTNKFDMLSIKRSGVFADNNGTIYINMRLSEVNLKNELNKFKVALEKSLKNRKVPKGTSDSLIESVDKAFERLTKK